MKKSLFIISTLCLFISCKQQQKDTSTSEKVSSIDYYTLGDSIAKQAQQVLLSNVSNAMQNGGPANAVGFCHANANEITDSLSKDMKVTIERISFKNRNVNNAPKTAEDSAALNYFKKSKEEKTALTDTLFQSATQVLYYKPIAMGMPTCLKCHGKINQDIDTKTADLLHSKYPKDKATN